MIYDFSLRLMGILAGGFLVLIGLAGLVKPASGRTFAGTFPRSRAAGIILLTIALVWSFWLLWTMEMGEFAAFRKPLLILLPIGYVLVMRFVDEFLAVRALGILCLLAAEPLIDAAFFRYERSRLLVTVFAYLLVIAGLLWVTMPYLLRDQLSWATRTDGRWRLLNGLAAGYGALILFFAFAQY